jgi:glycosyltransferase involved in cell wall biosynthesis
MITPQASSILTTPSSPISLLSEQRVIVVGATRNCEKTVRNDVLKLFESLRRCKTLSWFVVESDSSDKTLESLRALEADVPNFRFISLGSLRQAMPIRTQRIAYCRNVYLD